MNNHIFLGGTYNSTWRDKLISMLKCSYFNPIVPDWNKEAYQEELRQREFCDYCLYVITPNMTGMYSIAEAVDDSNKRPEKTIFCVLEEDLGDIPLTKFPDGVLSLVSDSFDLWRVLTDYLPKLKYLIISRNGKLVIRPDCLDDKSKILTPKGWKFFNDLTSDDLVAQVREDGTYEFIKPLAIINEPYEGEMYEFRDFHGKIDLVVTPNHRLVSYKTSDNSISIKEASEYKQNYWEYKKLRSPKSRSKGRELSPYDKFLIALQADGCIKYVNKDLSTRVEFNFQKERKHNRLLEILKNTSLEYNVYFPKSRQGQSTFSVLIPYNRIVSKTFNWVDTSNLDSLWCEQFIEELKYWDSSIRNDGRFKYSTTIKENIDVVELVAIAAGKGIYISESEDDRKKHFSNVFTAHILDNPYVGGQSITKTKIHYKGTVHCVKVPTGMILVKRNQGVCVTGNSGDPVDIICGKNIKVAYLKRNFEKEDCSDDRIEELREFYELKQGEFLKYTTEDYYTRLNDGWDWLDKDNNYWFGSNSENPEIFVYENKYFIFGKNGHRKQSLSDLKVISENEYRGLIELLWDIFGGTINEQGYKVLDPHIGMIYGEAINQDNIKEIFSRLESKGFAATNCFFGQGLK